MRESRIVAVEHVELETFAGREAELRWFYTELVGLKEVEQPLPAPPRLRFRSANIELCYALVSAPRLEDTAHRVTLLVDSLWEAREMLDSARMAYTPITGMAYTDRMLSLLDTGGNRVALRQAWRYLG